SARVVPVRQGGRGLVHHYLRAVQRARGHSALRPGAPRRGARRRPAEGARRVQARRRAPPRSAGPRLLRGGAHAHLPRAGRPRTRPAALARGQRGAHRGGRGRAQRHRVRGGVRARGHRRRRRPAAGAPPARHRGQHRRRRRGNPAQPHRQPAFAAAPLKPRKRTMDFHFTEYQATVESAVIALADRHRAVPVHQASFHLYGDALDEEIAASGFHQVLQDVELGTVTAVGVIMEIAKVPASVEIMASTLIRPTFCPDVPRPLALIDRPDRPVRFLPHAKSALLLDGDKVSLIELGAGDVTPVESLFAYPYGTLSKSALARAKPIKADANELRRLWQVGMAAEICGALDAALALT